MTYGFVVDVPAPIELYDAVHAEATRRGNGSGRGLLLHVGRATPGGFQVIEVWESREQKERFDAEVMGPALAAVMDGQEPPPCRRCRSSNRAG